MNRYNLDTRYMLRYILFTVAVFCLFANPVNSQRRRKTSRVWEGVTINPKLGPNIFMGDLVDKSNWRITTGCSVEKEVMNWMSLRGEMQGGIFAGTQNDILSFDTKYFDFTVGATVFPLDLISGYYNARLISPYISVTGGVIMFAAKESGSDASWANTKTGFTTAPLVCGILGARYRINKHFGVNLEINGHIPFSDDLDGHTGWSPDKHPGEDGKYAVWNDGKNDFYYTVMAGMTYKIQETQWRISSVYNRKVYLKNRKAYKKNAKRQRRR